MRIFLLLKILFHNNKKYKFMLFYIKIHIAHLNIIFLVEKCVCKLYKNFQNMKLEIVLRKNSLKYVEIRQYINA